MIPSRCPRPSSTGSAPPASSPSILVHGSHQHYTVRISHPTWGGIDDSQRTPDSQCNPEPKDGARAACSAIQWPGGVGEHRPAGRPLARVTAELPSVRPHRHQRQSHGRHREDSQDVARRVGRLRPGSDGVRWPRNCARWPRPSPKCPTVGPSTTHSGCWPAGSTRPEPHLRLYRNRS